MLFSGRKDSLTYCYLVGPTSLRLVVPLNLLLLLQPVSFFYLRPIPLPPIKSSVSVGQTLSIFDAYVRTMPPVINYSKLNDQV